MNVVVPTQQKASATFTFDAVHLGWIARRATALGMNKSQYLRWLIERDMDTPAPGPMGGPVDDADQREVA